MRGDAKDTNRDKTRPQPWPGTDVALAESTGPFPRGETGRLKATNPNPNPFASQPASIQTLK